MLLTAESGHRQTNSGSSGASVDTVAHAAILTISAIPDVLAVMLLLAAGYANQAPAKVRQVRTTKATRQRKVQPTLKVTRHGAKA
jgi:hypothetical protein